MGQQYRGGAGLPLVALIGLSGIASAAAPVAYDQTVDFFEGAEIELCGTDADGDSLTYTIETDPADGMLIGDPPTVTYEPGGTFGGSDDSFTFSVNDGTADSNTATVTITQGGGDVTSGACSGGGGGNAAPVADDQSVSLDEDTSLDITLTGSDPDSDLLTYSVTGSPINGALSGAAPNLTYTPDADFNGSDAFTFVANDGTEDSAAATVSITVDPVNDAPEASAQTVQGEANTALDITLTGTDIDGDTLTFSVETGPGDGTLDSTTGPDLTYTPDTDFDGDDSFTFTVSDGLATSAPATVDITIDAASALINDTGITVCANSLSTGISCTSAGVTTDAPGAYPLNGASVPAGQDALYGRDAYANDDSDGAGGFSFTKLDADGDPLPDQTVTYGTGSGQAEWACVRDNVTELVWEVKTDSGLHDTQNRYTWYDSNGGEGGEPLGVSNGGTCSGGSGCDTEKFVTDVNANGWCGATDWRLPTRDELIGIVHLGTLGSRALDTDYFPNVSPINYWSSNRSALDVDVPDAWAIEFTVITGRTVGGILAAPLVSSQGNAVRLVRGGR